jgi:hypothetical protein
VAGITREVLAARERLVFEWCRARNLPVAFGLGGGYVGPRLDKSRLIELHRLTLEAAAKTSRPDGCGDPAPEPDDPG